MFSCTSKPWIAFTTILYNKNNYIIKQHEKADMENLTLYEQHHWKLKSMYMVTEL